MSHYSIAAPEKNEERRRRRGPQAACAPAPDIPHYWKLHHSQTRLHVLRDDGEIYHYQKLHHSQTWWNRHGESVKIYHYQKLHHSQTDNADGIWACEIYHYQELHHSQTCGIAYFLTRWIYHYQELHHSQTEKSGSVSPVVIYHYQELHHSQTPGRGGSLSIRIYHYQELHHSQTYTEKSNDGIEIYHYQELHHSQTVGVTVEAPETIYHYQELHHSQTCVQLCALDARIYHYQELHHSQTVSPTLFSTTADLPLSGITSLSNLKPERVFGPRRAVRPSPALSFLTGRACQKIWQRSRSTVNRSSASIIRWQDGSSRKKWKCFRNAVRYSARRASSARQLRKPQKTKHAVPRRSVQRVAAAPPAARHGRPKGTRGMRLSKKPVTDCVTSVSPCWSVALLLILVSPGLSLPPMAFK